MRVGLLFGGRSGEHEVSIQSARSVYRALTSEENQKRYQVIAIYIQKNGVWRGESIAKGILEKADTRPEEEGKIWQFPAEVEEVELWLPILHGPNGEDGTLQGLLSLMQVPYVGSGVLGSALGMDKIAMKAAFNQANLPQVKYLVSTKETVKSHLSQLLQEIEENLGFPCFVKPANLGSSVGINKVRSQEELVKALEIAASYDRRIIIEAGIVKPREVECAVLGNIPAEVSLVGEITYTGESDFYDYETKYTDGRSQMHIPAKIPASIAKKIQEMSLVAFNAIDAAGLARVDFFYLESTGEVLINEINTLPGFTAFSMYPQLWAASGVSYPELIHKLIRLALERHQQAF